MRYPLTPAPSVCLTARGWQGANSTTERLRSWGFNSLGGWSATVAERAGAARGLYYAHLLDMGTTWLRHNGLDHDPWSAAFAQQCAAVAAAQVAPRATDEHLLGWQLDNELAWPQLGLAHFLGVSSEGQAQAVGYLRKEYHTIGALNAAWGCKAASFAALGKALTPAVQASKAFQADNNEWLGVVAAQYFDVATAAVKKHDPHHLILGMRGGVFCSDDHCSAQLPIIRATAKYVDVFDYHSCTTTCHSALSFGTAI